ncbi:MAG: hypothetical protein EON60_07810 [Alphaproteobacteria bacterium]|nr:MAG: hypothetical protein EON60_07810 [Alphaproteobacteria bacterium]
MYVALIMVFSLLASSAVAAVFVCPQPQALPATLNLQPHTPASGRALGQVQSYLSNLKYIRAGYTRVRTKNQRAIVADCLFYHVATLEDTQALQSPRTRADGATWFMLRQEVNASIALINPRFMRTSFFTGLAFSWLARRPVYGAGSPYQVSTR